MKTVKVTTDNKVSIIDVDFSDFKSIQQAIGGSFETVHTQLMADYFKNPSVIMGTLFLVLWWEKTLSVRKIQKQ